jgi:hypothetical protein
MQKIGEGMTTSIQIYPTATTGKSGSSMLDMKSYEKIIIKLMGHRLVNEKGEGWGTVTIYESASTTWASGTVLTAGTTTFTVNSVSDIYTQIELRADQLSSNNSKRYLSAYVATPTSTVVSLLCARANGGGSQQ